MRPPAESAQSQHDTTQMRNIVSVWPEMALVRDNRERAELMRRFRWRFFGGNIWFYVYVLGVMVISLLLTIYAKPLCARAAAWLGIPAIVLYGLLLVAIVIAYYLGISLLWARSIRVAIREHLQQTGVAVCIGCGYDCRGLSEARCPECGRTFPAELLKPRET